MYIVEQILSLRKPKATVPVIPSIAARFSPRIFQNTPITETEMASIFAAAKLAPSGRNHQPWFYFWTKKNTPAHEKLCSCIPERNQWAKAAPLLIVASYDPTEPIDLINKWAQYDLGQATMSLILQAQELGISCRQIGSFDPEKTKQTFPEYFTGQEPLVLLAMGRMGTEADYALAPQEIIDKELTPWMRKDKIDSELK